MKTKIIYKESITNDIFVLRLQPEEGEIFEYKPGQYAKIANPNYEKPEELHSYSIASSPTNREYLEFIVRVYGNWTQSLANLNVGDVLEVQGPFGSFYWSEEYKEAVFLVGGVAISTFISMLRYLNDQKSKVNITLLYGNRTPKSIVYKDEVERLISQLGSQSKVIHVLSDVKSEDHWDGYKGFFTEEIMKKEINFDVKPVFLMVGPPPFIDLMHKILKDLHVNGPDIKVESTG